MAPTAGRAAERVNADSLAGKVAVVTGAASGIGRETALLLARRGADLAVCDVNGDGLAATVRDLQGLGRRVLAERADVGSLPSMEAFGLRVERELGVPDIVVNNAGVGLGGGLLDTRIEDWEWVIRINLWGVIHGCHVFVPRMVARGRGGHVVNVASAAGFVATEALLAYSTTKFAVVGLSEALRDELRRHRIGVTAICPGIINTPITRSSRLRGRAAAPEARKRMIEFYERRNYGPEKVAEKILKAISRNAAVAPVTVEAWGLYLLKRLSPTLLSWFNRKLAERMERELAVTRND